MRVLAVALLASSLLFVGAGAGATRGAEETRPTLKLVGTSPVEIRAAGFRSRERVRVVVVTDDRAAKRVRAGVRGGFAVTFADLSVDRCSGLFVSAVGAHGSRASLKRPHVYCPPSL